MELKGSGRVNGEMTLIPSFDFKEGRAVRLQQGDFARPTIFENYSSRLVERALEFERLGARRFHMVDLGGAGGSDDSDRNRTIIGEVTEALSIPVQVGGGIRSSEDIGHVLKELGAKWAILGTASLDPDQETKRVFLSTDRGRRKLIADIGFEGDMVRVRGWQESSGLTVSEAVDRQVGFGFRTIVMTDKSHDGVGDGPNLRAVCEQAERYSYVSFIVSGGIGTMEHIQAIREAGESHPNIIGAIGGRRFWAEDGLEFFRAGIKIFSH